MTHTSVDYHIIIIGGGIVGLTLAALLAKSDLRVAILDQKSLDPSFGPKTYDPRVSAINRASENIFIKCGAWDKIKDMRAPNYQKMCVWMEGSNKKIEFDAHDIGQTNLGHIIENQVMISALHHVIKQHHHNVTLFPHFETADIQIKKNEGEIEDKNLKKLKFQLVVGADGKTSWLRKKMAIPVHEKDYQQTALITHVRTQKSHQHTAYQRFLSQGPLAFLPLNEPTLSSIVWSTSQKHAKELLDLEKETFEKNLSESFEYRLGDIETLTPLQAFPLHYQHAQSYSQHRVALIGDAAHTIHPMVGLGLNLGLQDAAHLAENILKSHKKNRDIGLEKTLKRYELEQKRNNTIALGAINSLKILFDQTTQPMKIIKELGIELTNHITPAKNFFARYALGII